MMQAILKPPCLMLLFIALGACAGKEAREEGPAGKRLSLDALVKSETGEVLEVHVAEARKYLRELMMKLYKRNPRELKKSKYQSIDENLLQLFDLRHGWDFPELQGKTGIAAIRLTFAAEYQGDRVFSFVAGLTSMIMAAYNNQSEFYLLQSVDPQNLYKSARNIEIAVWKLEHDHAPDGELYLYSNSRPGDMSNLSYERLFGNLIALQDTMAVIITGRTNRTLIKVVQQMATAIFLPILK